MHVRRKAAAADVDVMAHFVDQNQDAEPNAKFPTKEAPIYGEESTEAEQEFEFENGQKPFRLGEKNGNWRERAEFLGPGIFRRSRGGVLCESQLADVVEYPVGLGGMGRKKRQSLAPFEESLNVIANFFELGCAVREDREFFGINERVAASADEVAGMKFGTAGFALAKVEIQGRR